MQVEEIFSGKCICVIGGALLQLPAVRKAKYYGATVIVLDMNPQAVAIPHADAFIHCSTMDAVSASQALKQYSEKVKHIDAVFTVGTDASYTVAVCSESLGLPGISPQAARKATNKYIMRQALQEADIAVPRFYHCEDLVSAEKAFLSIGSSCVIKPLLNMGARGVQKVESLAELQYAWKDSFQYSNTGTLLLEQFIPGDELSIDALIYDEEVFITGIADRVIEYPPFFVETGHIMPSILPQKMLDTAVQEMKRAIKALGLTTGAAKGDIRVNSSGAWIGELAARLSGGFMSAYTYPLSSGVDVISNAMAIALGYPPFDLQPKRQWVSAEQAIMAKPGIISDISGISRALELPYIEEIFLDKKVGDLVTMPRNNMDKCGHIISAAPSREEALDSLRQAQSLIKVEIKKEP